MRGILQICWQIDPICLDILFDPQSCLFIRLVRFQPARLEDLKSKEEPLSNPRECEALTHCRAAHSAWCTSEMKRMSHWPTAWTKWPKRAEWSSCADWIVIQISRWGLLAAHGLSEWGQISECNHVNVTNVTNAGRRKLEDGKRSTRAFIGEIFSLQLLHRKQCNKFQVRSREKPNNRLRQRVCQASTFFWLQGDRSSFSCFCTAITRLNSNLVILSETVWLETCKLEQLPSRRSSGIPPDTVSPANRFEAAANWTAAQCARSEVTNYADNQCAFNGSACLGVNIQASLECTFLP